MLRLLPLLTALLIGCAETDPTTEAEAIGRGSASGSATAEVCHKGASLFVNPSALSAYLGRGDSLPATWYADADGDGFGDDSTATDACSAPSGTVDAGGDCDDTDADTNPGADESCDGLDNDCDGVVPADELDADADGQATCEGDCDDADASSYAGAAEVCGDGVDNDCDATVDEECAVGIAYPTGRYGYNYEWSNGGGTYPGAGDAICRDQGYSTATYVEVCGQDVNTVSGYPQCAFTRCELWYRPGGWVTGNCDSASFRAVTYIECE
jgi:hypothetical protein